MREEKVHTIAGVSALSVLTVVTRGRGSDVKDSKPGDVVYIEPGEERWHGATADRFMSHIAILEADKNGESVTWGKPTSDKEYSG